MCHTLPGIVMCRETLLDFFVIDVFTTFVGVATVFFLNMVDSNFALPTASAHITLPFLLLHQLTANQQVKHKSTYRRYEKNNHRDDEQIFEQHIGVLLILNKRWDDWFSFLV